MASLHGDSLRHLRFRETGFKNTQQSGSAGLRSLLSHDDLKSPSSILPRLEKLGTDLKFDGRLVCVIYIFFFSMSL